MNEGFCAGRVDEEDGSASHMLGPNDDQNELFPCAENSSTVCKAPFGASEVNIIYVNPGGPKGAKADPVASSKSIRLILTFCQYSKENLLSSKVKSNYGWTHLCHNPE